MERQAKWVICSYLQGTECDPSYVYALAEGKNGQLVHKETDDVTQADIFDTEEEAAAVCSRLTFPMFSYQVHAVGEELPRMP